MTYLEMNYWASEISDAELDREANEGLDVVERPAVGHPDDMD